MSLLGLKLYLLVLYVFCVWFARKWQLRQTADFGPVDAVLCVTPLVNMPYAVCELLEQFREMGVWGRSL